MKKLLLPLPEIKRYVKALKKSPNNTFNHTQLTDIVVKALGYEDLREYKFRSKHEKNFGSNYQAVDRLPLDKLIEWSQAFYSELQRHGVETGCGYCIFDKYIQFQLDRLSEMPALRISGLLFLLSYLSSEPFFEAQTLTLDTEGLISYLRTEKLTQGVKIRLANYAEKNRLTQSRYHEGVFSNLMGMWGQGSLSDERFAEEVRALLAEEIDYLWRFSVGHPESLREVRFNFPLVPKDADTPSNTEFMQRVRNAVHLNSPLLLGYEERAPSAFPLVDDKKLSGNLLLTNAQIKENIMISGVPGSGRIRMGIGIINQAIMAGSGCIYIDGSGAVEARWLISAMAKSVGRQDDVVYYGVDHESPFNAQEIRRLIAANKIVVLGFTAVEKDPEALLPVFARLLKSLKAALSEVDRKQMSQYFPCLIVLCDLLRLWRIDDDKILLDLVKKANSVNMGVLAIDMELEVFQRVIDDKAFRHLVIMKQCELPEVLGGSGMTIRDIINLRRGEFFYHKAGRPLPEKHKPYRGPYSDPKSDHLYLVIS